jgi:hypothetical protein
MHLPPLPIPEHREIDAQVVAFEAHRPGLVARSANNGDGVLFKLVLSFRHAGGCPGPILCAWIIDTLIELLAT